MGMVTLVSPSQPENALLPMEVTELGMTRSLTSTPFKNKW